HFRQRGAGRARRRLGRRRARAQAGRSIGGRGVPFARGPHRKILPGRAQPAERSLAPSSGTRASARDLPPPDQPADRARRGRDRPTGPMAPEEPEIGANPRARSANLGAAEPTDAPIASRRTTALLPRLPSPADIIARQGSGRP